MLQLAGHPDHFEPGDCNNCCPRRPQDPAGALRLRWSEETGCWVSGPVFVAAGTTLEYKFIVLDERSAVAKPHWQPGEVRRCCLRAARAHAVPPTACRTALCRQPSWPLRHLLPPLPPGPPPQNSVLRVPQDSDGCRFGVAAPSFEAPPQAVAPAGSSLPRRILAKCFDCGACILPHLHSHRCPKLYGLAGWEPSQQAALADPAAAC